MEMIEYYKLGWKNATNFKGRARRAEYWYFYLCNMVITFGGMFLLFFIVFLFTLISEEVGSIIGAILFGLFYLGMLASILPNLALSVRRLQDQDREWTHIFFGLIPFAGGIIHLIHMATEGTRGSNRFGPDPKTPIVLEEFGQEEKLDLI